MALYHEQIVHAAERTLQAVQKGFASAGIGLPDRQFLFTGTLAPADFDTPDADHPGILAVGVGPLSAVPPGAVANPGGLWQHTRHALQIRVTILRPVHTFGSLNQMPTPDEMTADATAVLVDTAILVSALEDAKAHHTIVAANTAFSIGPLTPAPTMGGYAGVVTQIDVDLLDGPPG